VFGAEKGKPVDYQVRERGREGGREGGRERRETGRIKTMRERGNAGGREGRKIRRVKATGEAAMFVFYSPPPSLPPSLPPFPFCRAGARRRISSTRAWPPPGAL